MDKLSKLGYLLLFVIKSYLVGAFVIFGAWLIGDLANSYYKSSKNGVLLVLIPLLVGIAIVKIHEKYFPDKEQ